MNKLQTLLLLLILVGFVSVEYLLGRAQKFDASKGDNTIDLLGFALLAVVTQPLIFWIVTMVGKSALPQYQNALINLPWYAMAALFLVFDDMLQYWWHRASHSALLWPLHRAHHTAHYMSARMIYRNNFFYYVGMPAVWMSGILVYLGGANVYLVYLTIKIAVITGAHSAWRWDEALYKVKALKPSCGWCSGPFQRHQRTGRIMRLPMTMASVITKAILVTCFFSGMSCLARRISRSNSQPRWV